MQHVQANVPADDYLVIGGDFNTDTFDEPCLATLAAVTTFNAAGPHPVDQAGVTGTNASRSKPYDQLLFDIDLANVRTATVRGQSVFAQGWVLDSRVYTPIAEIAPALATDSAASSMQRMGVVQTFAVPLQ